MRGKVKLDRAEFGTDGITPAYAGKSPDNEFDEEYFEGSPPPMRGKENACTAFSPSYGITPAYAGKSAYSGKPVLSMWDHPRLCGEKQKQAKQESKI